MSQSECSRWSRDKKSPKLHSVDNNMDPGDVPPELQGLTQIEEMHISAVMQWCHCITYHMDNIIGNSRRHARSSLPSWTLLVRVLNLSEALVLAPCRRLLSLSHSLLPWSLLTRCLLPSRALPVHVLNLSDVLVPGPYAIFSVLLAPCHVQADMRAARFLLELSSVFLALNLSLFYPCCGVSSVVLCWACATSQLCVSFVVHAHYVQSGHTDTRTMDTRSDALPLNNQMWGSLTLAPNNRQQAWFLVPTYPCIGTASSLMGSWIITGVILA